MPLESPVYTLGTPAYKHPCGVGLVEASIVTNLVSTSRISLDIHSDRGEVATKSFPDSAD